MGEKENGPEQRTNLEYELRLWKRKPESAYDPDHYTLAVSGSQQIPPVGTKLEYGAEIYEVFDIVHGLSSGGDLVTMNMGGVLCSREEKIVVLGYLTRL